MRNSPMLIAVLLSAWHLTACASSSTSSTTTPSSSTATPIVPAHGSTAWAVYLAVAPTTDDAAIRQALDALEARGISTFSSGELGCDVGASEALGHPSEHMGVAVYFANETDARSFATTLDPAPVGVVSVQSMCGD